ncbi:MAG: 6-hydroxymethylpterin diphosphokinase MptE-like protein [Sulfurospirillaceae bacterium]|nr:6-hydroxymethylpterin diphosphokinase MptE-like protein [Sulfurospirillaceae bacterium]
MNQIEQKAIETFQNNLSLLSEKHPEVFRKVDILNQAIENGSYKERYALEYKDGYFDILDTVTNDWLYGSSSIDQAKKAAKDINYKKSTGVIETFYNYNFTEEAIQAANKEDPTASPFVLTAPVIGFVGKLIDKNTIMKHIFKFIFFGAGLGVHLQTIHEKIEAPMYLIIEDNLEIFRLSLFVTDYSKIADNSELYFSIMSQDDEFKQVFDTFYHNSFIRNNYIKYSVFYQHYREKISKIQNFIVTQSSNTYLHDKLLMKNIRTIQTIHDKYNFLDVSKHHNENATFSKRPIILVAAGPSLTKEIKWLKQNAPFAIIVALFMIVPTLEKHGIKPDIVIHIDEGSFAVQQTLENVNNSFFADNILLLAPSVDMTIFSNLTSEKNIFVFEDRTRYRFNKGYLESFSVGEIAYALSLIFGVKDLYLLGLDLALDAQTKKTHAGGHLNENSQANTKDAASSEVVSLRDSEFIIKGNFQDLVPTTPLFEMSIHVLNDFTKRFKQAYQNIYNLSDGAYFTDTIPTKSDTVDLSSYGNKNSVVLKEELHDFFMKNASKEMDEDERNAFEERIKETKDKREMVLKFAGQRYPSMDQFREAFVETAGHLISTQDEKTSELAGIFIIYLENIGGYIGDFFNTENIENPKRNIKHFQKIIVSQLLKIIDKYLRILEEKS